MDRPASLTPGRKMTLQNDHKITRCSARLVSHTNFPLLVNRYRQSPSAKASVHGSASRCIVQTFPPALRHAVRHAGSTFVLALRPIQPAPASGLLRTRAQLLMT